MQLQIETINVCNARCVFCPIEDQGRPSGVMDSFLFERIIGQARDEWPEIQEVSLQGLGEPLLDPHIVERVRFTMSVPGRWRSTMYTNGHRLTVEKALALEDAGLSALLVSINAATPETRLQVMKLRDYGVVQTNVRAAIDACSKMKIIPKALVGMDLMNGQEVVDFQNLWNEQTMIHFEGNWAGTTFRLRTPAPARGCHRALGQYMVLWDGRVALCCFDGKGEVIFGNLNERSMREVYDSPEWVRYRESHARGIKEGLRLCASCTEI